MKKRFFSVLLGLCIVVGSLPAMALMAQAAGTKNDLIQIVPTNIRADSVVNYEGYGSLIIKGYRTYDKDHDSEIYIPAQLALIDRDGKFVFSYRNDPVGDYYSEDASFSYSNGIVSLTLGNCYSNGGIPEYYRLDGSKAFPLETTDREYTDENGIRHHDSTSWLGGPMRDGYAVVIQKLYSSWSSDWAGGGNSAGDNRTLIIDKNGIVTCELPAEYNKTASWGAGGFSTEKSLGWCGEGLFAFYDHTIDYDNDWAFATEVLGYMDPSGRTVIDLRGQGYIDAFPFHEGLAAVIDQSGKIGFIDKTGRLAISCIYDGRGSFCDGLCPVRRDGKWGYINQSGSAVIPFVYDSAYGADGGLAAVEKNGKFGLVDYSGSIVVPFEYDDISSYNGGVAYGIKNGQVYLMTDYSSDPPDDGQLHGTVTAIPTYAASGETVTLRVTPDPGYQLALLEVTDNDGTRPVSLSDGGSTYTFPMPAYDVTVHAKFTKI